MGMPWPHGLTLHGDMGPQDIPKCHMKKSGLFSVGPWGRGSSTETARFFNLRGACHLGSSSHDPPEWWPYGSIWGFQLGNSRGNDGFVEGESHANHHPFPSRIIKKAGWNHHFGCSNSHLLLVQPKDSSGNSSSMTILMCEIILLAGQIPSCCCLNDGKWRFPKILLPPVIIHF